MNSLKDLIFDHYCYENPDSAISLSEELALKASESAHIEWLGHSHNLRGIAMNVKGEIAQSMNHYEKALKIYLEIDDQLHSEEIDFPNLQIAERVPESFSLPKPATTENSRILLLNLDLPPPDRQSLFQVYTI